MFSGRIDNCYDSHVHWAATGDFAERMDLKSLTSEQDITRLKMDPHARRGDWLLGFGWDQNHWPEQKFPSRQTLDQHFDPKVPICFLRIDGHAMWLNSEALRRVGLLNSDGGPGRKDDPEGGKVLRDQAGLPTGILIDTACQWIYKLIPEPSPLEIRRHLLKAMKVFNLAGFTHIRDLTCGPKQWEEALHLERSGLLSLAVEQYFDAEDPNFFEEALRSSLEARKMKSRRLRVRGVKIFFDGALGSEGALISHPYQSGSGKGLRLLTRERLEECMIKSFGAGVELAIHAIGDEAGHEIASAFRRVSESGVKGKLHIEHAEMMRPETVELLAGTDIECHLQPCHWLSDSHWLDDKLGELKRFAFPWRALQEAGVHFDFGSDSPIEPPSLVNNLKALDESAEQGVPRLLGDPVQCHSHPDSAWVPNTYSVFANGIAEQVVFNGEHLF